MDSPERNFHEMELLGSRQEKQSLEMNCQEQGRRAWEKEAKGSGVRGATQTCSQEAAAHLFGETK
jgi:hypothetical protein